MTLVIPAYNEAGRLSDGIGRLCGLVPPETTELLVVDDGSADGTPEIAARALEAWPRHEVISLPRNAGKGAAVRAGVLRARGDVVAYLDADMATDPNDLSCLIGALRHCDVAIGSRAHQGSVVKRNVHRRVMNRTFGMLVAALTKLPYMDTQCGFKAFNGSAAKLVFHGTQVDRFAFDVEVLDLAARIGLRREEVAVHWTDVAGSHVRPVYDGVQMLGDVIRSRVSRNRIPPVRGLVLRDLPIDDAGSEIGPSVRSVDLLTGWGTGTAVLFPMLSPRASGEAWRRLSKELAAYGPEPLDVDYRRLIHPGSIDLRARAFTA